MVLGNADISSGQARPQANAAAGSTSNLAASAMPSTSAGSYGAIGRADEVWESREDSSRPAEATSAWDADGTVQGVLEDATSVFDGARDLHLR